MTAWTVCALLLAGVGAGLAGSIAGIASVVSYPALLAVGLGPLVANVTNTVALTTAGAGSVLGSRPELVGQGRRVRSLAAVAVLGGASGALLLLATPPGAFAKVVPVLIALASLAVLAPPRRTPVHEVRGRRALLGWAFVVAIYGGYFGAAAGVVMLAALLALTGESLPRANAVKNAVLGIANGVAAVGFMVFGPVRWSVALPLAVGLLAGSRVGPVIVRHAPTGPLRALIALGGLAFAVHLALGAYR